MFAYIYVYKNLGDEIHFIKNLKIHVFYMNCAAKSVPKKFYNAQKYSFILYSATVKSYCTRNLPKFDILDKVSFDSHILA